MFLGYAGTQAEGEEEAGEDPRHVRKHGGDGGVGGEELSDEGEREGA